MDEVEFQIGDVVTVDRYNHIDDTSKGKVVGYGEMPVSKTLTYKIMIDGYFLIQTTGISIMESKKYQPVDPEDRHEKKYNGRKSSYPTW